MNRGTWARQLVYLGWKVNSKTVFPLTEYLLSANRVICDYPSTGFYESVTAGVPTVCLYHEALKVRKSGVDYFGNLMKPFSKFPKAINIIDEFLSNAPNLYIKTMETGDESVLNILKGVSGEEHVD
jgi:hypothetical protein